MRFIFFDLSPEFGYEIKKYFPTVETYTGNIRDYPYETGYCYVSPANSLLYFTGGVDMVYYIMFRDLQKKAFDYLKNAQDLLIGPDGKYLPIGSGVLIETEPEVYIAACPTMYSPEAIDKTRNVYHAFLAALRLVKNNNKITTLLIPGMGTGYGKMTYSESAKQIYQAYLDFI